MEKNDDLDLEPSVQDRNCESRHAEAEESRRDENGTDEWCHGRNPDEPRSYAECRRQCRRNFWTQLLTTVAKVAGVVLAAFGLQSFQTED